MRRSTRTRTAGAVLILATLVASSVQVAAHGHPAPGVFPQAPSADLAPALTADGTFVGAAGVSGTVDTSAWTLTSDLAAGEPPRFGPAVTAPAAPIGSWNATGNGPSDGALNVDVYALAVSGSDLYVGGWFTNAAGLAKADYVARWDGSAWSALGDSANGSGTNGALNGGVFALAVSGSDLYVGGGFTDAAGLAKADYVARWDGSAWSALGDSANGSGTNGALSSSVSALAVSGSDLYVGGYFANAAGLAKADYVARWNGSAWSALGDDQNGTGTNGALDNVVLALAASGSNVYVGGWFGNAAGLAKADRVAKWDGSTWSALGDNLNGSGTNGAISGNVSALAVSGTDLYVGGYFTDAAGLAKADRVAKWDGSTWSALGDDLNGSGTNGALDDTVYALAASGSNVYVGGSFSDAASLTKADHVAKWDGSAWSALGDAVDGALSSTVTALAVSGTDLYVGGWFSDVAGLAKADFVAKWDGSAWSALGDDQNNGSGTNGALNGAVTALAVSGNDVYVGGWFTDAAGLAKADYVARWNGSAWSALGDDQNGTGTNGAINPLGFGDVVSAMAVSGGDLYVGGAFLDTAGLAKADYVARWNGSTWSALGDDLNGTGTGTDGALNGSVHALAVSGTDLYVGGFFIDAAGLAKADFVAKWNGSAWSALGDNLNGSGTDGALNANVYALAVSGTDLYVGGWFTDAAGLAKADYVAKWDGTAWSALGDDNNDGSGTNGALGPGSEYSPVVTALAVSGTDVYVGGFFINAAGLARADYLARWDGSAWSALGDNNNDGSGTNGALPYVVDAVAASGSSVYAGGSFTDAANLAKADYLAAWRPPSLDSVAVTPANPSIAAGLTEQFSATGTYTDASHADLTGVVSWASGTLATATISGTGLASGVAAGTSSISATLGAVSGSTTLTVTAPTLVSIAVTPTNPSIAAGLTEQFSATGTYSDASHADLTATVTWASGTLASATISATGLASGVAVGTSSISATLGSVSGSTILTVTPASFVRKPDGRIRLGTGAFAGNDVYNATGVGQSKTGSARRGATISFGISVQNDGSGLDSFTLKASGAITSAYTVNYFRGATDITAAVVAGTYTTTSLAPGATYLITAKVKVKSTAAVGSKVTRLVTISSVGDGTKKDAVKFIAKRA